MATLIQTVAQAVYTPAALGPATGRYKQVLAWCLRPVMSWWQRACQHAERHGRSVPYY